MQDDQLALDSASLNTERCDARIPCRYNRTDSVARSDLAGRSCRHGGFLRRPRPVACRQDRPTPNRDGVRNGRRRREPAHVHPNNMLFPEGLPRRHERFCGAPSRLQPVSQRYPSARSNRRTDDRSIASRRAGAGGSKRSGIRLHRSRSAGSQDQAGSLLNHISARHGSRSANTVVTL